MSRKQTLTENQIRSLLLITSLSKELGWFTLPQIAKAWGISVSTLRRYTEQKERALSRTYSRKQYLSYRKSMLWEVCYTCRQSLTDHARCLDCTCLAHGYSICEACVEARQRRMTRELPAVRRRIKVAIHPMKESPEQIARYLASLGL